jgi:hypothetical protein
MTHLVEKHALARVNAAVMLALVGGGLAACAIAAIAYDFSRWFW